MFKTKVVTTVLPRQVEEDVVRETAPGGVVQQPIQQSAQCGIAECLGWAEEDFLKEAEQRGVEQEFLREAALLPVDELLAWEELPRHIADVSGREEARELISQDPSLQTPPRRVVEDPLWLFGLEIQKGHPRNGRHPQRFVLEKVHGHHREQSPGQTPKGSVAQREVAVSKSRRGVEPPVVVEEGRSARH
jgi:hypothetical protein